MKGLEFFEELRSCALPTVRLLERTKRRLEIRRLVWKIGITPWKSLSTMLMILTFLLRRLTFCEGFKYGSDFGRAASLEKPFQHEEETVQINAALLSVGGQVLSAVWFQVKDAGSL